MRPRGPGESSGLACLPETAGPGAERFRVRFLAKDESGTGAPAREEICQWRHGWQHAMGESHQPLPPVVPGGANTGP